MSFGSIGRYGTVQCNMVRDLSEQILKYGEVRRGVLGIAGGELTPIWLKPSVLTNNKVYEYKRFPKLYEPNSAPWYTEALLYCVASLR